MQRLIIILAMLIFLLILGWAGNDDYQNEVATAAQTAEIKAAMQQRAVDGARDDAAYRALFVDREIR